MRALIMTLLGMLALAGAGCEKDGASASCDGVTCSGNGTCAVAGSETFCVCDPGFGPAGEDCVPCGDITAAQAHDIVVPAVRISGSFTVANGPPPLSDEDTGDVWLESAEQGRVRLGATHEQIFSVRILPGTYEVFYRFVAGGDVVPRNTHVRIGLLEVYENLSTSIDVPSTAIHGAMSLNGGGPPASEYDDGIIVLTDPESDDEAIIANTHDQNYTARVVPGHYDVRYRMETGGAVSPTNTNGIIDTVDVPENGGDFDFAMISASIGGDMTLNGQPFPASEYEDANLYLASADGSDLLLLANTHDGSFEGSVLVGEYEIYYQVETGGALVPSNQWGHVGSANISAETTVLDINVQSFVIGGAVSLNGEVPPASEYDDGNVSFNSGLDTVFVTNTHSPTIELRVIGGSYNVLYALESPGSKAPINENALVLAANIDADVPRLFAIDIQTATVTGDVLFNGALAPASEYNDGHIVAYNKESGDRAVLANTHDRHIDVPLVRGLYDLYYEVESPGDDAPANQHALVGTLDVNAEAVDQAIELSFGPVGGGLRLNGNAPPATQYDNGIVSARSLEGTDYATLANTNEGVYDSRLVQGVYNVFYDVESAGGIVPENIDGRIGCFALSP